MRIFYSTSFLDEPYAFLEFMNSLCTRYCLIFSPVSNECQKSKPTWMTPINFICMDLTLTEDYWIIFFIKCIAAMSHNNYYTQFYNPFCILVFCFYMWIYISHYFSYLLFSLKYWQIDRDLKTNNLMNDKYMIWQADYLFWILNSYSNI